MIKRGLNKASFKLGGGDWSFQKILFLAVVVLVSLIFIEGVDAAPSIEFVDPTPSDGTNTTDTNIETNVSITESELGEMKFNWNGVNYTFYDDSLVLMMNFDNISALGENDTHVVDVSKYGNNGTIHLNGTGKVNMTGGKYAGAIEFDGEGDYVDCGNDESLNLTEFTISAWVYDEGKGTGVSQRTLIDKTGASSANGGYNIYVDDNNILNVFLMDGASPSPHFYTDAALATNQWTHIAVTWNGSTVSESIKVYFDGTEQAGTEADYGTTMKHNTRNVYIGAYTTVSGSTSKWNGTIDEVRIWNRSLSANEVKQQYYGNLYKYDTDKWVFYTNESDLNINGNTYFATASDSGGNENLTEMRTITLLFKTTQYYDNRKMAVVWTCDDWEDDYNDIFVNISNYAQSKKVVLSPTVITGRMNSSSWEDLQTEIDEGFVLPVSHSVTHPHVPYSNTTYEVCDSRLHIIGNLTLLWQNWFNGSEYLVSWADPAGQSDSAVRGNLSECNYLIERKSSQGLDSLSWATWNNSEGLYERYGIRIWGDEVTSITTLNSSFNIAYSGGKIYHFSTHPQPIHNNWSETDKIPQHLSYIGNRTDVWYVGWGQLYMYHYLEDRVTPTINLTTRSNQMITAKINASGTERNKYGLSYPVTYAFSFPSDWSNAYVYYKNTSSADYTAMTEKTSSDFFNGIDAYRTNLSENAVYVSKSLPQTSNEFYLKIVPILSTNFGGSTTDLTAVALSNITNLVLENPDYGKINFSESINLSSGGDLNTHTNISHNRISINSTALSELNKSATLTLYNLTYINPRILKDGSVCPSTICTTVSYSGGTLIFNVTSFSAYSAEETPTTIEEPPPSVSGGGYPTFEPTQEQLEKGYEKSLRKNWKITFEFNNKSHTVKLDDIVNKTAVIAISSESVTFNLTINETKKLNLDDDNYYDLKIFLKDISDYRADLVLKLIHEEIPKCEPNWECTEWSGCVSNIQTRICADLNDCNFTEARPDEVRNCEPEADYITIVIVSALIAAVVIVGFLVRKQLTKKEN